MDPPVARTRSADDAGNGFACDDSTLYTMTGDYGDVTAGVDPDR